MITPVIVKVIPAAAVLTGTRRITAAAEAMGKRVKSLDFYFFGSGFILRLPEEEAGDSGLEAVSGGREDARGGAALATERNDLGSDLDRLDAASVVGGKDREEPGGGEGEAGCADSHGEE